MPLHLQVNQKGEKYINLQLFFKLLLNYLTLDTAGAQQLTGLLMGVNSCLALIATENKSVLQMLNMEH